MALTPNATDNQRDKPKSGDRARNVRRPAPQAGEVSISSDELLKKGGDSAADQTAFVPASNQYRKNKPNKARAG